jgi:hypothetical protein
MYNYSQETSVKGFRCGWEDNVIMDLGETVGEGVECIEMVH